MVNRNLLRKLAFITVIALMMTFGAGCRSLPEEEIAVGDTVIDGPTADVPSAEEDQPEQQPSKDEQNNEQQGPQETDKEPVPENPQEDVQEPDQKTEQDDPQSEIVEPDVETPAEKTPEESGLVYDESKALVVVSYNIKCAMHGKTVDQVVDQIKAVDADIVGFQEVDLYKSRSNYQDQIKLIAEKAGYPYYKFEPVLMTGKSHEKADPDIKSDSYGHAVMSKYPILKSEIIWPTAQTITETSELRNFGRHEIDVDGTVIAFYNCHLDSLQGRRQYYEIQGKYMAKDEYAICVGDFNENHTEFGSFFDYDKFYNFTFGENGTNIITRGASKKQLIDHIIVTKDKFVWKDGGLGNGLYQTEHDGASDHHMIYCHLNIIK